MRAIFESIFDILYLTFVIGVGVRLVKGSRNQSGKMFGGMALVLGVGDSFHLVPRVVALLSGGAMESFAAPLGAGKFLTSLTMTVFYVILYYIYRDRYPSEVNTAQKFPVYAFALIRILLCLFPQNRWLDHHQPLSWAILRNVPFLLLGLLMILLFYRAQKKHGDCDYRYMWLTIVLSFGFYLPVVLFGDKYEPIGLLMIPKTLAYVWTVMIGYMAERKGENYAKTH